MSAVKKTVKKIKKEVKKTEKSVKKTKKKAEKKIGHKLNWEAAVKYLVLVCAIGYVVGACVLIIPIVLDGVRIEDMEVSKTIAVIFNVIYGIICISCAVLGFLVFIYWRKKKKLCLNSLLFLALAVTLAIVYFLGVTIGTVVYWTFEIIDDIEDAADDCSSLFWIIGWITGGLLGGDCSVPDIDGAVGEMIQEIIMGVIGIVFIVPCVAIACLSCLHDAKKWRVVVPGGGSGGGGKK